MYLFKPLLRQHHGMIHLEVGGHSSVIYIYHYKTMLIQRKKHDNTYILSIDDAINKLLNEDT